MIERADFDHFEIEMEISEGPGAKGPAETGGYRD